VNKFIIRSIKKSIAVFVPSKWIKKELNMRFRVQNEKIYISPLIIQNVTNTGNTCKSVVPSDDQPSSTVFFYPAAPLPYKNHQIILDACKLLKDTNIDDFKVVFTFTEFQSKTAQKYARFVKETGIDVSFTGALSRDCVMSMYSSSVLIFPSKIETDAMPLLECALKMGYILVADLPYAREALEYYPRKQFFHTTNVHELYSLMKEIIQRGTPKNNNYVQPTTNKQKSKIEHIIDIVEKTKIV
jgi:glycosyltransferase involved in cell wall biosynthesis